MLINKLTSCLLIALACMAVSLPGQAAMVTTTQMQLDQAIDIGGIEQKRDWIREQLVIGGVEQSDAVTRVAAMTDAQVLQIHQRIDESPAGGNALVLVILIVLFTELMGYTDLIPAIRPAGSN